MKKNADIENKWLILEKNYERLEWLKEGIGGYEQTKMKWKLGKKSAKIEVSHIDRSDFYLEIDSSFILK